MNGRDSVWQRYSQEKTGYGALLSTDAAVVSKQ